MRHPESIAFRRALLASLLVHGLAVALVARQSFPPAPQPSAVQKPPQALEVRLARESPQPPSRGEPGGEAEGNALPDMPPHGRPLARPLPAIPSPSATVNPPPPTPTPNNLPAFATAPGEGETDAETEISATQLSEAITAFSRSYRQKLNQQWLEACQHRHNATERRDCRDDASTDYSGNREERGLVKQLFSDTQPDLYHSPLKRKYESANENLAPLIEAGGLAGRLAQTRANLNRENLLYLNRRFASDSPGTVSMRICIPMPCVFRYTGFEVVKPEGMEEEEEAFRMNEPEFP